MASMKQVLAMVLAGGQGRRLYPLTRDRAKPAVPFGGKYRIIDFTLSNCINSGVRRINVLTQYKSVSLSAHLRDGWSILNPEMGEFITQIPPHMWLGARWYEGTADAIYQNVYCIEEAGPRYTLILAGDHIYKMDYGELAEFHEARGADVTVAAIEVPCRQASDYGVLAVDPDGAIVGFEEKPAEPKPVPGRPEVAYASMGIYLFNTEVLIRVLEEDAEREGSTHDFGRDVIPAMVGKYHVFAYPFSFGDPSRSDHRYWRDVGTLDALWEANMDLASVSPAFDLYDRSWPIRTYEPQYPPAKTVFADVEGGRAGMALDSLVCGGGIISGGRVIRSILSHNVRVNSYAEIFESVLFDNVEVGRRCRIRRAIIDKDVQIPADTVIGYNPEEDARRFTVSPSGVVVIPKGMAL